MVSRAFAEEEEDDDDDDDDIDHDDDLRGRPNLLKWKHAI